MRATTDQNPDRTNGDTVDFTAYLTDHCAKETWWQYAFPNGHGATVWIGRDRETTPFRFSLESSDTSEGEPFQNYHGVRRMHGLTTEQVEAKLARVAALDQNEDAA